MLSKSKELIDHLAFQNAKNIVFYSEDDYLNKKQSSEDNHSIYCKIVLGKEFSVSDLSNPRAQMLINSLEPFVKDTKLDGRKVSMWDQTIYLKCNLHDSYSEKGTLSFGCKKGEKSVLIPDLYHMSGYNGSLDKSVSTYPRFENKIPKIVFAGSSTGSLYPHENKRLTTACWSKTDSWARTYTDIFITNLVQMNCDDVQNYLNEKLIERESIIKPFMSIDEQLNYKYILSIDGNTWAWDRPVWVMNQKSVLMKYDSNHIGWYYPCLKENIHYIPVNTDNMGRQYWFLENNPTQANEIMNQAHQFVKSFCTQSAYQDYLKHLIRYIFEQR